jgi:hypothetical protein
VLAHAIEDEHLSRIARRDGVFVTLALRMRDETPEPGRHPDVIALQHGPGCMIAAGG